MLQWMGGSRRKVTTSSKSTQKRQKQYFEQRKRLQQQQEHKSSGPESYTDKKVPYMQCNENNRSLDVLSLLNLSKTSNDCTSRVPEGMGSLNSEHTAPNYQTVNCTKTIQTETEKLCPSEHVVIRETRIVSNHLEETVYPQGNHPDASRRNSDKDPIKTITEHKLSVVDMLGDDEQNSSSRGHLVHEKHVAFSVEGLGKVEMETPVHSPQHPTRNFSYAKPAPSKNFRGSHCSKNLNYSLEDKLHELDDMAFGVDVPTNASSLKFPPYLEEPYRNTKHNSFVSKDCLLHDADNFLRNDEFYDSRVEHDAFKQDEKYSFLDRKFVDDNCGLLWKNWSCDSDSSVMNHMRSRNYDKPDFSFEDIHMQKRRASAKTSDCFDVSGLSSSYKQQTEHDYDFMSCYPARSRNSDFSEMTNYSAWPSFTTQDTRDCLSFVSEDSCLSHSVWHEETKKPSFRFTERHEADFICPIHNFAKKTNTFTQELWQKESGICSRMHNKIPEFSTPGDDWLFEEQRHTKNTKPCYASVNPLETQMDSSFRPFDSDFNPKFYADEKEKPSEHDAFSGNLFSDESIYVKTGRHESFSGNLYKEEKDSLKMQFQESVSTGETKSATPPAISSTLHQRNHSSSENGAPVNALESENDHSCSEESNVKTPEMTACPNAVLSPLRSDGGSSSVEMPQKVEEYDVSKECANANGSKTSLLSQNELKSEGADRSCKVMMLGSFVLQLM
ncbi:hypothetical protein HanHA300_Chr08g0286481 [Helianthus annuus]|nr:uncharacterized protein LOC110873370 isoform X1 [Helianthus annuus]XP_021977979.1 uncharacterized protein LOC110873370 isoform X1 [Helianthus annuus]XP_035831762.1 uncharacterized protein LOC110873370 isoform X1 [Helianthus annuus]KAJ0539457.1 hypothetical protein HanHA300_Chr08g0286481 [Helianthus annuus]